MTVEIETHPFEIEQVPQTASGHITRLQALAREQTDISIGVSRDQIREWEIARRASFAFFMTDRGFAAFQDHDAREPGTLSRLLRGAVGTNRSAAAMIEPGYSTAQVRHEQALAGDPEQIISTMGKNTEPRLLLRRLQLLGCAVPLYTNRIRLQ